jgi:hypothetical protein
MRRIVWLQTATVFWLGGGIHFSQLFNVYGVIDVRQTKIHTAEPLLAGPSASEFKMVIEKLKRQIIRY